MMNKPSYYAIIPANVRYDKNLTANAKLLYGEITALCNKEGHCWAGNQYFAELYSVSKVSISTWISNLKDAGHISVQMNYKEGSKHILNRYIRILGEGIQENFDTSQRKLNDPIQENLIDNKTDNNKKNITVNNNNNFDSFWKYYPRKAGKSEAIKAWNKLLPNEDLMRVIAGNISERLRTGEWSKNNQSFILHASTYLNQKRWEDEVIGSQKKNYVADSIKSTSLEEKLIDTSWAN